MALDISIRAINLNAVISRLKRRQSKAKRTLRQTSQSIGNLIVRDAIKNAPRKTGKLERNIRSEVNKDLDGISIDVKVPLNSAAGKYAKPMHERRYKSKIKGGRRFIKDSISDNKKKIIDMMQRFLRGLKRV